MFCFVPRVRRRRELLVACIRVNDFPPRRKNERKRGGSNNPSPDLPGGDPAIIGVACSIVADMTNGKFNLLKWDKQERKYYPIHINLFEKGELDESN